MVNFIAIKVRSMKIWDADQRGEKGGKVRGVWVIFDNVYKHLIRKVAKRFLNVCWSLNGDRTTDNKIIANFYTFVGVGEWSI
jgi:hypothetical protein